MTESKKIIIFELDQTLSQALKANIKEEIKQESIQIPIIKMESDEIDKKRMIKRWKMTEGYFYLHPEKFRFSNKDL